MNIALFGTSADPPTLGHQTILNWLSERYDLCVVWVSHNPFKSHQASIEQRIEMMRLSIDSIDPARPNLELHPEISSPRTLITVQQAREIWQDAKFTLVVGSDLVRQLPTWYQADRLLRQVKILVVPRPGFWLTDRDMIALQSHNADISIGELTVPIVSSSAYRNNGDKSGIIPSVAAYIEQEHLYEWQVKRAIH